MVKFLFAEKLSPNVKVESFDILNETPDENKHFPLKITFPVSSIRKKEQLFYIIASIPPKPILISPNFIGASIITLFFFIPFNLVL